MVLFNHAPPLTQNHNVYLMRYSDVAEEDGVSLYSKIIPSSHLLQGPQQLLSKPNFIFKLVLTSFISLSLIIWITYVTKFQI